MAKKVYTSDKVQLSKQSFKIGASAKTKLTYKVTKGSSYVSVNKNGKNKVLFDLYVDKGVKLTGMPTGNLYRK